MEVLADRADSYAMAKARVDGNDVLAVRRTVAEAAGRARAGEGPTLVEALTYRQKGHSRSDPAKYRPEGELEEWLARDPIVLHGHALVQRAPMSDWNGAKLDPYGTHGKPGGSLCRPAKLRFAGTS